MMTRPVREIKVREKKRETVSHADASHTQSLRPRREKTRTGRNETRITRRSSRNCPLPPTTELTELYHSASPPPFLPLPSTYHYVTAHLAVRRAAPRLRLRLRNHPPSFPPATLRRVAYHRYARFKFTLFIIVTIPTILYLNQGRFWKINVWIIRTFKNNNFFSNDSFVLFQVCNNCYYMLLYLMLQRTVRLLLWSFLLF